MVSISPLAAHLRGVQGFIDFHGSATPVFDLRIRMNLPQQPPNPDHFMVITDVGSRLAALVVDEVEGPRDLYGEDLQSADSLFKPDRTVKGIARLPDGLVVISDLESFLTEEENQQLNQLLVETAK